MDVLKDKTENALLVSLIAELAKTTNELKCAKADLQKAQSRLQFCLAVANEMLDRPQGQ